MLCKGQFEHDFTDTAELPNWEEIESVKSATLYQDDDMGYISMKT